ncbi:trigger factor [candidate division KSB1 bacterium]|nr:trigger factor [candidate division KSB1 bacterium]
MEYQITSQPNWHTVVHFIIDADKVRPELQSKYAELQKKARVEGFRKGHVPESLLRKMYGKSIEADIFEKYIRQAYEKFFKDHKYDLLSSPEVKDLRYDDNGGLQFDLHFDVRPVFDVTGYEGMPVEKEVYELGSDDFERMLQNLRERNAMVYNVEGEARAGHYIKADLQELDHTGVPIVGKKIEGQVLYLKEDDPELTPQLINTKAGDERRIVLKVERNESNSLQETAPEDKYYHVKITEVKERRLPDLDDEFAKDLGPYQTLDELRIDVEKRMREQASMESRMRFHAALADELIKRTSFEVPPSMLEAYLDAVAQDVRKNSKEKIDEKELRAYYRPTAIRNIKWILIRNRMIEQFDLSVSDEELQQVIDTFATEGEAGRKRAEELQKDKKARERFRDDLEDEKVYSFLARSAQVTEIKKAWRAEEEREEQESDEE